jgi:hypothetical protein
MFSHMTCLSVLLSSIGYKSTTERIVICLLALVSTIFFPIPNLITKHKEGDVTWFDFPDHDREAFWPSSI